MLFFIISQQFYTIIHKDATLAVLQQFLRVEVRGLTSDMVEPVHAVIATHAIHGSHPESAPLVAEYILDLIVGQSQRVVVAEILVVFVSVVSVQSAEGAYPQLSCGILADALHSAIRQLVCYDEGMLLVFIALLLCLVLAT